MSAPFPDAELVLLNLLEQHAPTVTALPPNFVPTIVVVERVGGAPDLDSFTDYPLMQVSAYGATRPAAWELVGRCQSTILRSPLTLVGGVLIEDAEIVVGGQQVPDLDPDDRRVVVTVRMALDLRPLLAA